MKSQQQAELATDTVVLGAGYAGARAATAALVKRLEGSLAGGGLALPSLPEVALKIRRALADDNVSVTVNGRTYQCSGGGSGGNPSPGNLCRCRREAYSGQDYDYYLEKYTPSTGQYTQLQSFRSTAQDNGESDRVACESARNDPACYFSASQLEKALQSLDAR